MLSNIFCKSSQVCVRDCQFDIFFLQGNEPLFKRESASYILARTVVIHRLILYTVSKESSGTGSFKVYVITGSMEKTGVSQDLSRCRPFLSDPLFVVSVFRCVSDCVHVCPHLLDNLFLSLLPCFPQILSPIGHVFDEYQFTLRINKNGFGALVD